MREVGDPGRRRRRAYSSRWTAPPVGPLGRDLRGKSHLEAGPVWVGEQAAFSEHAILQPMRFDLVRIRILKKDVDHLQVHRLLSRSQTRIGVVVVVRHTGCTATLLALKTMRCKMVEHTLV